MGQKLAAPAWRENEGGQEVMDALASWLRMPAFFCHVHV